MARKSRHMDGSPARRNGQSIARPVIQEPPFPPLLVGIYEGNELAKVNEMPDPRVEFCKIFNERYRKLGYTARPLDTDEVAIARNLLARKAVAHA